MFICKHNSRFTIQLDLSLKNKYFNELMFFRIFNKNFISKSSSNVIYIYHLINQLVGCHSPHNDLKTLVRCSMEMRRSESLRGVALNVRVTRKVKVALVDRCELTIFLRHEKLLASELQN